MITLSNHFQKSNNMNKSFLYLITLGCILSFHSCSAQEDNDNNTVICV